MKQFMYRSCIISAFIALLFAVFGCASTPVATVTVGTPLTVTKDATPKETLQQIACHIDADRQVLNALLPPSTLTPVAVGIISIVAPASAPADIALTNISSAMLAQLENQLNANAATKCPSQSVPVVTQTGDVETK